MKHTRTYIALGGIIVLAVAAFIFVYPRPTLAPTTAERETPQASSVSLTIAGLYAGRQVPLTENETVLQVLQGLEAQDPQLKLSTKVYSGMGTLVTGMHGDINGAGKNYWQYKVNGISPEIGADAYKLKRGDRIEWFFGTSEE